MHQPVVLEENETHRTAMDLSTALTEFSPILCFWILDHSARQLSKQSQRELLKKALGYHRNWLHSIVAARKHTEDRQQQGRPPREILEGIGLVEWKRRQTGRGNQ